MPEESGGEKTLPASPQKLRRAREKGNIARSQDLNSGAALMVALLAMLVLGQPMFGSLITAARHYFGQMHQLSMDKLPTNMLAARAILHWAASVLPFMVVMTVAGLAMSLAQVGILFTSKPLQPQLNRLNPISGMKKFASLRSLIELAKSLSKLALVSVIVWLSMRNRGADLVRLMDMTPVTALSAISGLVVSIWWRIALAMIVLGLFDFAYQKWQHAQDQRMTQQEARRELKELEGDPHIKRRIRQLQRQLATQRMMRDVPKADVIITNPTHTAVALRYDLATMNAPVVVAKGMRLLADRIREIAIENDVPIVHKPELARTLYRTIELNQPIPEDLFRAVAEVLSFVYNIDRRADKIRERQALFVDAKAV